MVLLGLAPEPEPPAQGSPTAHFFAAFAPTGYLTFVKVLEVLGGVLVAVPMKRRLGLLVLGPIIVNVVAFHVFVAGGDGTFEPVIVVICLLVGGLLWVERSPFLDFMTARTTGPSPT